MESIIKIKSITNVITNSSTEVFTIVNEEAINTIKEMVNSIFAMCNYPHKFDDIFDIKLSIETDGLSDYYEDWLVENDPTKIAEWRKLDWREQEKMFNELNPDIIAEVAKKHDEQCSYDGEGSNAINGITVVVKPDVHIENADIVKKVANYLSNIDNIFESETRYC